LLINIVIQISVELMHQMGIYIDSIKQTQQPIVEEYLADEIKRSDPDVRSQHSTLNNDVLFIDALHSSSNFIPRPLMRATMRVYVEVRHFPEKQV
jgi:hypothetical protein